MDELIKALREKYIQDITTTLSPSKVLIFFIYLLVLLGWGKRTDETVWNFLISYKASTIINTSTGPFSAIEVKHLLIAIALTIITDFTYRKIKVSIFIRLAKKTNFDQHVRQQIKIARQSVSRNQAINLFLVRDIRKDRQQREMALVRKHMYGELFLAASSVTLLGLTDLFLILDLLLFFSFLYLTWVIQIKAFLLYTIKVIPLISIEKAFLDEEFDLSESIEL